MQRKILTNRYPVEIFSAKMVLEETINGNKKYLICADKVNKIMLLNGSAQNLCNNIKTVIEKNIRKNVDSDVIIYNQLSRYNQFNRNNYYCKIYYDKKLKE